MEDLWVTIGAPLLVVVIGLAVEYWIIQPLRFSRTFRDVPRAARRDWITATVKAIKRFRKECPECKGVFKRSSLYLLEKEVRRGHAILTVGITEERSFWQRVWYCPRFVELVQLVIDRTGDILAVKRIVQGARSVGGSEIVSRKIGALAPFLYIAIGFIGACGGFLSIFIPLLYIDPDFETPLALLPIVGIVGGLGLALAMDRGFGMEEKASGGVRSLLALVSGVVGGWLGILALIVGVVLLLVYILVTGEPPRVSSSRK